MANKGMIFDVKKFSIHDGPGIRSTVFFKGCPLRCRWCHNPEGISAQRQVMLNARRCLADCRDCLAFCKPGALAKKNKIIQIDRDRCEGCGLCAEACPAEALQMAGRTAAAEALAAELARDEIFYQDSGGGVTFSGGEPLAQIDFLQALLQSSKARDWHTVVDTCGHAPYASFSRILPLVDLFLFDLKIIDGARHRSFTGVSNRLILENLSRLSAQGQALAIRIPLIPGFNDSPGAMAELADFCAALPGAHRLHLLPYHPGGSQKNRRLGQPDPWPGFRPPPTSAIQKISEIFAQRNLELAIGG